MPAARATTATAGGRGSERRRQATAAAPASRATIVPSCSASAPGGIGPWYSTLPTPTAPSASAGPAGPPRRSTYAPAAT